MESLSAADMAKSRAYEMALPKQYGNLHERMKYLVEQLELLRKGKDHTFEVELNEVIQAVYDLEAEVPFYTPVNPPFASRLVELGSRR